MRAPPEKVLRVRSVQLLLAAKRVRIVAQQGDSHEHDQHIDLRGAEAEELLREAKSFIELVNELAPYAVVDACNFELEPLRVVVSFHEREYVHFVEITEWPLLERCAMAFKPALQLARHAILGHTLKD